MYYFYEYGVPIIIGSSIYLISYGIAVLIKKYRKKFTRMITAMFDKYVI